jgi:hypothetical protein
LCWQTVLGFWCFRVSPAVVQASFSHPKKHATWRRWVSTAHLYARRCGRLLLSVLAAKHAEPAAYDISARHCLRQYPVFSLRITGKQARCSLFAYLTQTMHDALLHIFWILTGLLLKCTCCTFVRGHIGLPHGLASGQFLFHLVDTDSTTSVIIITTVALGAA